MAKSLQDKLATFEPGRRAGIEAEAERMHSEYVALKEGAGPQAASQTRLSTRAAISALSCGKNRP